MFEDQPSCPPRESLHVLFVEMGDLLQSFGSRIVGPDVHGPISVREEVDLPVLPDRMEIRGAIGVGEVRFIQVPEVQNHQRGILAASIAPPLRVPPGHPIDNDAPAVG